MSWLTFLATLIPEILKFLGQMLKRQWGKRGKPLQIIKSQNAIEELEATRDHIDKVLKRLKKSE